MTTRKRTGPSEQQLYESEVAAYVAAGGNEQVQRVITAAQALTRKLSQWYTLALQDVGLSAGEWTVLSRLARAGADEVLTPSALAEAAAIAPSSMTHRLDKMAERGLIDRTTDPSNRTRIIVTLTTEGWNMFRQVVRDSDILESDVLNRLTTGQREQLATLLEKAIAGLDDLSAQRDQH
ncbi:winged helix-turn-helix transcriptional regulator [Calidifontibacter sp. DB0510]|uniref:Winged helix-turn-helix transcriptional regulator n=1 Tax=Metallococcus carri TaxID=1656884 RepID=A0A967B5C0_9MICO|nr:MarR family winged helix-turn-helix transcriptional regulator [Metallococcus carri]NHN55902.1 winged helix-turn-helix transcriptional regulator [Metallococcus carri]NOP38410.1 winged helix-turn-helix transcriptional regulator [Calidifontibacter sp. DB2511S]